MIVVTVLSTNPKSLWRRKDDENIVNTDAVGYKSNFIFSHSKSRV